ncbi:VOC family protein [Sphaerisporangium flaviroseum]|uniref:VOC family protein n=1 Tax=Sphaerisporangium flaviroseum TaxID=509199 RepID=A0ABP7I7U8_9ACTN
MIPERGPYPDGAPCWPELTTDDPEAATRFYREVFGWTCKDLGPRVWNYTVCLVDDKPVAGITPPAVGLSSVKAAWTTYLATSDLEASAVRVEANNGKLVILPSMLSNLARCATAVDVEGATFGLWQAETLIGSRLYAKPGGMCWSELYARNTKVADPFYEALFGYEQDQIGDGIDYDYVIWSIGDEPVCGRLRMPYESEGVPAHWKTYFTVDDCDATEARIAPVGGEVLVRAYDMPHGRVAMAADPTGALFAICQHHDERFTG